MSFDSKEVNQPTDANSTIDQIDVYVISRHRGPLHKIKTAPDFAIRNMQLADHS